MTAQQVNEFLANYVRLCQQYGIMIDSWGQESPPILSPCYKDRLIKVCSDMNQRFLSEEQRFQEELRKRNTEDEKAKQSVPENETDKKEVHTEDIHS